MSVTGAKTIPNTVRIWDVQHKTCSKILTEYGTPFTIACSPGSFLLASTEGTVKVYDSQSHDIIQTISVNDRSTHSRFSIGGDKILLATKNSGYIWDLTKKTLVRSINYNGDYAMFSPDGTFIASIYGKFLKIWKTTAKYNRNKPSSHIDNAAPEDIFVSPDEGPVVSESWSGAQMLDAANGLSLFAKTDVKSIVFSSNSAFSACLIQRAMR